MKLKSVLAVVLALVLLLSACSTSGGNESANTSNEQKSGTETSGGNDKPSGEPTKLVWFSSIDFWNPPSVWSTDPNTVPGKITEKTGVTFEFNIPAQDGETKLNLMLVSGNDFPDVITITNDVLGKKLIEAGKVWDLDEFIKKYDPESHLLKDFPADVKATIVSRDGGFYAFPSHIGSEDARKEYPPAGEFYKDMTEYLSNGAIVVNGNLLKEAGLTLDDIKTESGLLAAYQKIKDMDLKVNGAPVIPLLLDGKGYMYPTVGFLLDSFGYMPVDKDGNFRDSLLAPEMKLALKFLYKAQKGGYFDSGQMTVDNAAVKADMASGRVFTFIGNSANTSFQNNDYWTSPGPILSDAGTKPVLGRNKRAGGGWMKTYISKSVKDPEKVAKWLSFMSSREGMMLHIYGIEGVHYTLDQDGLVVKTEQGIKDAQEYMKTGLSAFWPFHHTSFSWSTQQPPNEKTDIQAVTANRVQTAYGKAPETHIYNNAAFGLPGDLFPPDSKFANDELQIKAYRESQITKIVMAKNDAEFEKLYEEMITQLMKLGIEQLNAEKNKYVQQKLKEYGIDVKGINS
ncbi:type 2 periplasmic-binding domain-containing protein [Paenibacillus alkalitolerans]|uniref:extracellular solute-binding protein n=1 Tax=Paenibacillus alkalitolerans TaxID=2799335 RepID=UPI0018F789E6|nr:extracellular solute-binding protein [Paenibacillus alkalitolerans]